MTTLNWPIAAAIFTMALSVLVTMATPAAAQTAPGSEAQQYADQDPDAVLRAMKARLAQPARGENLAACQAIPAQGLRGVRNKHDYFLSEVGGCAQLACFLAQVPSTIHDYATLVVDQECSGAKAITETLVLPNRFTLAGVGINGAGALEFQLPDNVPAIRFQPAADVAVRMVTIRDLSLAGNCCNNVGIDVSNSQYVYVKNVRLQNFAFGILGDNAFSIFVDQSSVHDNAFNLVMGENSTSWRVRDSTASQGLIGSSQLIGNAGLETQSCFNMSFAGNSADVNQC